MTTMEYERILFGLARIPNQENFMRIDFMNPLDLFTWMNGVLKNVPRENYRLLMKTILRKYGLYYSSLHDELWDMKQFISLNLFDYVYMGKADAGIIQKIMKARNELVEYYIGKLPTAIRQTYDDIIERDLINECRKHMDGQGKIDLQNLKLCYDMTDEEVQEFKEILTGIALDLEQEDGASVPRIRNLKKLIRDFR